MVAGKNDGLEAVERMAGDGDGNDGGMTVWRRWQRKGGRGMGTTASR